MDGLSIICAGLGTLKEDDNENRIGYSKGEYCLDNLKDLLRFLRRDDPEKRDVFKQLCKWNIVGKDLIPIIEYCQDDRNLVLNAVKVLVFLTMPVEPTSIDIPQQIEYLWGLKAAITFSDAVPVIVSLLESPLENLEKETFSEDDWKLVQLIFTLFRNILAIQDVSTQQKAGGSTTQFISIRDRFLQLMFQENVMDLILVLSQHTGGYHGYLRKDNLLFLEIFYYIFKGQEPELIAKIHLKGSKVVEDTEDSVSTLQSIIKEEQERRKLTRLRNTSCYSQFSGTFTRINLDGSKALFKGNPCSSPADALLKAHKNHRGSSKRTTWDHGDLPSTRNQILKLLYEFINQFLTGGYNVLMQSIREDIEKEQLEFQSSDIVVFFYVARFVTSFQYYKYSASKPTVNFVKDASVTCNEDNTLSEDNICGPVVETLNESMFLMVISKWRYAFEGIKQTKDYKFLSAAGSLVKIMIRMLDLVLKQSPEDSKEHQTARILLYKLFYDQTEEGMTHFILNLIKSFDTHKQAKSDLADLVESMHVILRLMENLQARGTLRVSRKSRKKKSKAMTKNENVGEPSMDGANVVGDSTCEESVDVNMSEKDILRNQDFDGEKGESNRDSIQVDKPASKPANLGNNESEMEDTNMDEDNDGLYPGTDDSSDDEQPLLTNEVDLNVSSLVSALASNTIIQNLCWLLKLYKSNSFSTNHHIISMLRRICDDLELSPMLYQLSLLTIFYEILEEQKLSPCREYENIVTFLTTLVRRMLRKMKSYPLLFVEVLFWKTRKECHYISCGSMINELNSMKNGNGEGRSGTKNGGYGFSEGQKWVPRNIADALGDDDFTVTHQDSQEEDDSGEGKESTMPILNNGIEISDMEGYTVEEDPDRMSTGEKGILLNDELEVRLKDLYEKYKDNPDLYKLIAEELDPNGDISEVQVSKTLKQLGLKAPAKKKMHTSGASKNPRNKNRDVSKVTTQQNLTTAEESSSSRKPMNSRKRVHAFSLDQEQKIRDLFNQFKDHKRCSYMIANALDGTEKFSAVQISRKLKQLGLLVPKKKSDADMHIMDESLSDRSSDGAGISDDETLSSLKNRGKHRRNGSHSDEKHNQKIKRKLSKDTSSDELLSVSIKSKKRSTQSDNEELMTDSVEKNFDEERDEFTQANPMDVSENEAAIQDHSSDRETRSIAVDSQNASGAKSSEIAGSSHQPIFDEVPLDELADFDEDTDPVETAQENSVLRRRQRMVIDFDDDE